RRAVALRALLSALAVSLLGLVGCDGASKAGAGSAQELRAAARMEAGRERVVALPDPWEDTARQSVAAVRYRLVLPDAALRTHQSALFVPHPGTVFGVRLNGRALLSFGAPSPADPQALPETMVEPLLLPLPQALLRPADNEIEIEVSGMSPRGAGLSTVWVGPLAELEPLHRALDSHQVRGAWVVSAAATVMGALALLLAWRAQRFVYACFGAASLLWAWRMSGVQLGGGGVWPPVGAVLFHASQAWFVVLMALYALAAIGRDTLRVRRVLAGWALAVLLLAVTITLLDAPLLRGVLLGGTLLVIGWLLPVLFAEAWRERSTAALLLSAAALASVVVGARDFVVFRVLHDYGAVTWSRYTILLLLAVLAWLLVDEFARAGAALRGLNRDLQDRVAEKERELQAAFEATREQERTQAVMAERDRILREMHDGLGGRLVAALALTAQVARQSAPPAGGERRSVHQPLNDLKLTLDDCLVELRLALDSLETDQRPLVESLGELRFRVEPSLRAAGVRLVWQVGDAASEVELAAGDTLHVLRIVREALTNVIKHAQATVAWLQLETKEDGALVLSVIDNGLKQRSAEDSQPVPLFVPESIVRGGRGLANMQRRAAALGAALESGPHPEGWAVTLLLPRQPAGLADRAGAEGGVAAAGSARPDGAAA
ncbi:sensor histidine kinase, partial [Methylibium sp.]|uniref:sensor histidine kinase n=1 Tax=Methylibium sp. TaxID=2067992 RepID=UPI001830C501